MKSLYRPKCMRVSTLSPFQWCQIGTQSQLSQSVQAGLQRHLKGSLQNVSVRTSASAMQNYKSFQSRLATKRTQAVDAGPVGQACRQHKDIIQVSVGEGRGSQGQHQQTVGGSREQPARDVQQRIQLSAADMGQPEGEGRALKCL